MVGEALLNGIHPRSLLVLQIRTRLEYCYNGDMEVRTYA
jgi:hypothetical protein